MKSYWIAARVVLLAIWPSGSNAYVAGLNQSKAEDQPSSADSIIQPLPQSLNLQLQHKRHPERQ